MKYYSTRDNSHSRPAALKEAAFMGLAPDGGLFLPEKIAKVDMREVEKLSRSSYADMSAFLAKKIFEEVPASDMEKIVKDAYNFPIKLQNLDKDMYTLELFHGPTCAFKDFGARFMGRMTGFLNDGRQLTILTATSGDTGSAVARGFEGVDGVRVIILYPDGKVSPLQEAQMTTIGENIHPVKVNGNFDDCQRLVKAMFRNEALRKDVRITSANSINILRWIPQAFYYFYAYCMWKERTGREKPEIVVPSGNYGNLAAGMFAWKMGLPVKGFVAASNVNDVVPEYLLTGKYRPHPSIRTVANAMDVGDPSNFERMTALCGNSFENLKGLIRGFSCNDDEILAAIAEIHRKYGYVSDPHSAVGYLAAKAMKVDGFWLSTADAAKFGEVIRRSIGQDVPLPESLQSAMSKPRQYDCLPADESVLEDYIRAL